MSIDQSYEARRVANLILSDFDSSEYALSNMKLNKILYYVHGWGLVRLGRPLLRNRIEAWNHGPVIRTVYEAFKKFGDQPIREFSTHLDFKTGRTQNVDFSIISAEDRDFILRVATHYMQFSASELRSMSHVTGGPWAAAFDVDQDKQWTSIPNGQIFEYFRSLAGDNLLN